MQEIKNHSYYSMTFCVKKFKLRYTGVNKVCHKSVIFVKIMSNHYQVSQNKGELERVTKYSETNAP